MNAQETTFAVKNAAIVAALRDNQPYVYFKADDDYYSLIGVIIDGDMERMPAPLCVELLGGEDNGEPFFTDDRHTIPDLLGGRQPLLTLSRNTDWQAGNRLLADICKSLASAEDEAWIDEQGKLIIHKVVSRDPSRRNNGGEYDFYRVYRCTPVGVVAEDDWSCDIQSYDGGSDVYMTDIDDLCPLLAQAREIVEAAQRANRTPFDLEAAAASVSL